MSHCPPSSGLPTRSDRNCIIFALIFPALLTFVYFSLLANAPTILQNSVYSVLKITQFSIPFVWVRFVQGHKLSLRANPFRGQLPGIVFGSLVLLAMWCLYKYWLEPTGRMAVAEGPIRNKIEGFGVATLAPYITLAAFYSLIHSGLEEYYWRWFVFGQLCRQVRFSAAVLLSSLGFTAHHILVLATFFGWTSLLTWIFSAAIMVGGIFWAWLYSRSESIYPTWVSHMFIDIGIFVIGFDLVGIQ